MVFSSLTFLFLFFPLVMGVYYLCPRALRNLWLLLTSLLFYAWGEPVYIRLMAASILFNYLCGLGVAALQKREKKRLAKGLLILCIAGNIGALGLFKYADLLIGTVNNIAGSKIALLELRCPSVSAFTPSKRSAMSLMYTEAPWRHRRIPSPLAPISRCSRSSSQGPSCSTKRWRNSSLTAGKQRRSLPRASDGSP